MAHDLTGFMRFTYILCELHAVICICVCNIYITMCLESKLTFSDYVHNNLFLFHLNTHTFTQTHVQIHTLSSARELICHIHLPPVMCIEQLESRSVLAKQLSAGTHGGNKIGLRTTTKI